MGRLTRSRQGSRANKALANGQKLTIMDWYVHQGHQYEFFKTGHNFYLAGMRNAKPDWNSNHRPLSDNVTLITEKMARQVRFDIVMIRSPVDVKRYRPFIQSGAIPIAVMQTTNHFSLPPECKHVVWNSVDVMNAHKNRFPYKNHKYIVHGYDPDEFTNLNKGRNSRVLTVANVFKGRSEIMGFPLWASINRKMGNLDVIGHGNMDLYRTDRHAINLKQLINMYNTYSIYFNPTQSSAMPRSRAEAMMCGCPIVSTNNFDIGRYIISGKNGFLSNDRQELIKIMRDLLKNPDKSKSIGAAGREAAIKHFHINDYIEKWEALFRGL